MRIVVGKWREWFLVLWGFRIDLRGLIVGGFWFGWWDGLVVLIEIGNVKK